LPVEDSTATVAEPAARAARARHEDTAKSLTPLSDAFPGPEIILHKVEIEQTRRTAITGTMFCLLGLTSAIFVAGHPFARMVFVISLALSAVNNAWLWYVTSSEERYHERWLLVYFGVAPILNAGILYHIGVFGPLVVMFVLNIYTACLTYGRRLALVVLVGSVLPFAVLGSAVCAGWLDDPGLMTATPQIGGAGLGIIVAAFSVFLVLVYVHARSARELIVTSLGERDDAVRRASHREALFLEARHDLERALRAGGLGRFTDQILGSYKLGAVLGRGGMGEVYEAHHVTTGEVVAVKTLRPEVLAQPQYVRRFLREVRIAGSLDSPHIVRVIEVGNESAPLPYLAMERLHGEDLAQRLRREERLEPAAVVELVRQVGRGLAVAAAAGIVHRDLKPQNLFLAGGDVWKILDFGVSKLLDGEGLLTDGEAIGTPQYMAPEQARGQAVDARADLYALGAIVYRALTGHQPYKGDAAAEVLLALTSTMPVRPSALAALPRDVDVVLAIAMAKFPDDRFASSGELVDALEAALAGRLDEAVHRRAARMAPWREPKQRQGQ
jgi:serine/threonine-protein kinase